MRFLRLASLLLGSLSVSASATVLFALPAAAQLPPRDPQALAVLSQALAAMGGTVPADSVATGTIELMAGSSRDIGTIRILTRRLEQSAEHVTTPTRSRSFIYSRRRGLEIAEGSRRPLPLELVVTTETTSFPLIVVARALTDALVAVQYIGLETVEGMRCHHVRIAETFGPNPRLQHLAEFSRKDLWIDAASGLPRKLFYERRESKGPAPGIPIEVIYSDFRLVGGLRYPFLIRKTWLGSPQATITIQNVALNTGLSDADFPVR